MKEERRKQIEGIVFTVTIVVVMSIMFFNFFVAIRRGGEESYRNQMITIANNHAKQIGTELQTTGLCGQMAASVLASRGRPEESDIIEAASLMLEYTEADRIIYHEGDETGIEWNGEEILRLDLKEYSYYKKISGVSDIKYTYVRDDGNGRKAILIIVPVGDSTDTNLLIFYPMEKIHGMMRIVSEFETGCFAALINVDGRIITHSDYESNYFASPSLWNSTDADFYEDIIKAKKQIGTQMSGCFEAVSKKGEEEKTLVYAPIQINQWTFVIGVNQEYVSKREKWYWKKSGTMLGQMIGVLIFFLTFFCIFHFVSNKKSAEEDRKLREKADTDLLTGLSNKLATERSIKEYIEQNPNTVAMMFLLDIDNFKKINDTLGHAFGDEVLRTLGHTIGSIFRVTDIIGRTGGDEFTIFLKFLKNDENTLKEAQKLVRFFHDFTAGEYVKYSATASIGAAVFPADGATFDALYKAADAALYKAKERGKNQLAFYDDRDRKMTEE